MRAAFVVALSVLAVAYACDDAMTLIEEAEGLELCEYVDTTGHPTICYGFNLDDSDAQQQIEAVGGDYASVMAGGCLTQTQCTELLQTAESAAAASENSIYGSICPCIDAVLTDMVYNLGAAGIQSFTTFNSYIQAQNWASAASDLKGTLWCSQVGNRCTRDCGIIAAGCGGSNDDHSGSGKM